MYSSDEYKPRINNKRDLLIPIKIWVQVEELLGSNAYLYRSTLYNSNGMEICKLLNRIGATFHIEIEDLTGIKQQTANGYLQKLILIDLVQKHTYTNILGTGKRHRPYVIYSLIDASPEQVLAARSRLKEYLVKQKLSHDEKKVWNKTSQLVDEYIETYQTMIGDENKIRKILVKHGLRTLEEQDKIIPEFAKELRAVREAGV